ncbi:hypothetical protein L1D19_22475 [Vibrio natriegens]|uniref:hypothetical protein n=1 Tax=Vibrio natriegens TaxID=691 RepID=UPI001EFD5485|nr:hypothetical protein [Vibrio natriegens]MCG9702834.1 hypothetical protein [Vibrio natriegens]
MNISEAIAKTTVIAPDGTIWIRKLSDFDPPLNTNVKELLDLPLWDVDRLNFHGTVSFSDTSWLSPYEGQGGLYFPECTDEFAIQIRILALIKLTHGQYEGHGGLRMSTVLNLVNELNSWARYVREKNSKIPSFHQMETEEEGRLYHYVHDFFTEVRDYKKVYPSASYIPYWRTVETCGLIGPKLSAAYSAVRNSVVEQFHPHGFDTLSYTIIPTRILGNILKWASSIIDHCEENFDKFCLANQAYLDAICQYGRKSYGVESFSSLTFDIFTSRNKTPEWAQQFLTDFTPSLQDLKTAVYIYVSAFVGIRLDEKNHIVMGGADKDDSGRYYLTAIMSKTGDVPQEFDWTTNKETVEAINLLEKFSREFNKRAESYLSECTNLLSKKVKQNLTKGRENKILFSTRFSARGIFFTQKGNYTKFIIKNKKFSDKFDIKLTVQDIAELERLECNYRAVVGDNRGQPYSPGDDFNLSSHQFRHTFAYFYISQRLGELEDLKDHFLHQDATMTWIYAHRGYEQADALLAAIQFYEKKLKDVIAEELADQALKGELKGGGGEQLNKIAHDMVIGITEGVGNSKHSKSYIKQVHFKNIDQLKRFLAKNLTSLRGLAHGYCTAGEDCKIKNAAEPTECVFCPSYIAGNRHKSQWRAMKEYAVNKLSQFNSISDHQKDEMELFTIVWEDMVSAADLILNTDQGEQSSS